MSHHQRLVLFTAAVVSFLGFLLPPWTTPASGVPAGHHVFFSPNFSLIIDAPRLFVHQGLLWTVALMIYFAMPWLDDLDRRNGL